MSIMTLTECNFLTFTCPQNRSHFEVFDTLIKGFFVDIFQSGYIAFRVQYKYQNKKQVYTIGNARIVTLQEAKDKAVNILRMANLGLNPKTCQQVINSQTPTLKEFF